MIQYHDTSGFYGKLHVLDYVSGWVTMGDKLEFCLLTVGPLHCYKTSFKTGKQTVYIAKLCKTELIKIMIHYHDICT